MGQILFWVSKWVGVQVQKKRGKDFPAGWTVWTKAQSQVKVVHEFGVVHVRVYVYKKWLRTGLEKSGMGLRMSEEMGLLDTFESAEFWKHSLAVELLFVNLILVKAFWVLKRKRKRITQVTQLLLKVCLLCGKRL